jgi:Flp pilus assembly protein TadD
LEGESCVQAAYEALLQGDFDAAAVWFVRAVEAEPDNPSYYFRGSVTLARSGRLGLALRYARRAVELAPDETSYALQLRLLESRERIDEAQRLLSLTPSKPETAISLLKEAFRLDPLAAQAKLLLGVSYRLAGDDRSAREALREALLLNPQYEEASRLLREMYAEQRWLFEWNHDPTKRTRDR